MRLIKHIAALAATTLLLPLTTSAQNVISLVGNAWTLHNDELNVSVPAHLPSQAHLDLYANQVTGDPYFGLNDLYVFFHSLTKTSLTRN
jgi:beta-mannosidase